MFETFHYTRRPAFLMRVCEAIANGEVKEKGCWFTTESLQANQWLPLIQPWSQTGKCYRSS